MSTRLYLTPMPPHSTISTYRDDDFSGDIIIFEMIAMRRSLMNIYFIVLYMRSFAS